MRWLAVALFVLVLAVGGFVWWALTPLGPEAAALAALEGDDLVSVEETSEGYIFLPTDDEPRVGLILYPGGRVDHRSYATLAHMIAERGYKVVLTSMPLNMAVFNPNKADEIIEANPEILMWNIGGHSLGGAMAAQYAEENHDTISGLALLASYPPGSSDLSDNEGLSVVSIYGSKDGVLNPDKLEGSFDLLPEETRYLQIDGGNHAQFGYYGEQPGDGVATIPPKMQQELTMQVIVEMLIPMRILTH